MQHLWNIQEKQRKNTKEYKYNTKETRDSRYIYQNELDKGCFQHDMVYGVFKDLHRRANSGKTLRDKKINFAENRKYDGYQRSLVLKVYKFQSFVSVVHKVTVINSENQQLAEESQKTVIKKFKTAKSVLFF